MKFPEDIASVLIKHLTIFAKEIFGIYRYSRCNMSIKMYGSPQQMLVKMYYFLLERSRCISYYESSAALRKIFEN
jgi:hypothetical protein